MESALPTSAQYGQTDPNVSIFDQMDADHSGPVCMVGTYIVAPGKMDEFLEAWTKLSRVMRKQPGNLGGQMHRAIGEANVYVNYATWESVEAFRAAYKNSEFWEVHKGMPTDFAGRQLLVQKIAIPGLCVA